MDHRSKRMLAEYGVYQKSKLDYIKVRPNNDTFTKFNVLLKVLASSLFENGYFELKYEVCIEYPFKPPKIIFLTPLYHPNISNDGKIYLDILKDMWSPALSLMPVLVSLHSILQYPNFSNPCNLEFGCHWKENEESCRRKANEICYLYAYPQLIDWDDQLMQV